MKALIKILTVLLIINGGAWSGPEKASAQVGVSFQIFYDQLSPYGNWIQNPDYGYVWVPGLGSGFTPYGTGGHWVFTAYGWTWVSDYPWGWAPFHYGGWYFDPVYGWIWVPGTEWAPAWVAWRSAPGYYGWTPLGPGIGINVVLGGGYHIPHERWIFVHDRDITRPDIDHYYGPRTDNERILNSSTVINRTYEDNSTHTKYISGPDRNEVQKVTGKEIQPVQVRANDKPGQSERNGELNIYRPQIQKTGANGQKPAPQKVDNIKDVKPVNERSPGNNPQHANPVKQNERQPPVQEPKPAPPKQNERQVTPKQDEKQAPKQDPNSVPPKGDENRPASTQNENAPVPQEHDATAPNEKSQDQPHDANSTVGQDQQPSQPQVQPEKSKKNKRAAKPKEPKPK